MGIDDAMHLSTLARCLLGQGYYVASHLVNPKVPLNTQRKRLVGGQMILA